MFLDPGYPYEQMLQKFNKFTELTLCSYLGKYQVFNRTQGGLILLKPGQQKPLDYVAHTVYLESLYHDYIGTSGLGVLQCGEEFAVKEEMIDFSTSQVNYILGENPMNMSYVVGYGNKFPRFLHHRGASIPADGKIYSCKDGWVWFESKNPDPNILIGTMVGGPNISDIYMDVRSDPGSEPSLVGNAELVAALISLTHKETHGIDKNRMFYRIPPFFSFNPSPPPPWEP